MLCRFFIFFFFLVMLLNLSCHIHVVGAGSPVKFLPGFDGPLPLQLETGYIGVGKNEEVQLFYYFIKSDSNPQEDPLILWITGGKTCSALRSIFQLIGPLLVEPVEYNGSLPTLLPFPFSWTKVASFIFLDLPVGTGFSYATTSNALQSNDLLASSNAYEFLQKWLVDHPEFLSNPFYVGGHSYAGITVPIITEMISDGIERGIEPLIQLKGYILGSPKTFPTQENYLVPYAHQVGLISDQLYESLKQNCKGDYLNIDPTNGLCLQDLQTYNQLIEKINVDHILEPICLSNSTSTLSTLSGQRRYLYEKHIKLIKNPAGMLSGLRCRDDWSKLSNYWANDYRVQEALHVRKGTKGKWEVCNQNLPFTTINNNSMPYHVKLSKKGYRSLVYSGDHELILPFISIEAWIESLNYSIVDDWRPWIVEGQVAGYTRTYANRMTFATVKGGGHPPPDYRPFECQVMFKRWISYKNL